MEVVDKNVGTCEVMFSNENKRQTSAEEDSHEREKGEWVSDTAGPITAEDIVITAQEIGQRNVTARRHPDSSTHQLIDSLKTKVILHSTIIYVLFLFSLCLIFMKARAGLVILELRTC